MNYTDFHFINQSLFAVTAFNFAFICLCADGYRKEHGFL